MKSQKEQSPASRIAQLGKELEIEAALERVRAIAMGMKAPDDLLSICETMFHELKKLGFDDLRNAMINIHYDDKGYLLNYDYSESTGRTITTFVYNSHPIVDNLIYHAKQSKDAFTEMVYSGEALDEWRLFRKENGEADEARLNNTDAFFYYFYSIGTGAIGISAFSAANPEQLNILKRFRNVFDFAYRRFTDISEAEAHAREAQIELALERVRAKTMAMQHSNELLETSQVMFEQLRELGQTPDQISIAIVREDEGIFDLFATIYGTRMIHVVHPKIDDPFAMGKIYKNWKAGKKSFVVELGGEELRKYNIVRNQMGGQSYYSEVIGPDDRWIVSGACFSRGVLSFSSSTKPAKEAAQLLERFAKVFDSTYTRFLDLQKAEAQAREAEVQLALERVRARTMAMQRSDELPETAWLIYNQVKALGAEIFVMTFHLWNENRTEVIVYGAGDYGIAPQCRLPAAEDPIMLNIFNAAENGESLYVEEMNGTALAAHFKYLYSVPSFIEAYNITAETPVNVVQSMVFNAAFMNYGYLLFNTVEPCPQVHDLFKRFAKEFEQTYTRFLDLQRAEAQAREAKIEAALEKVRASALAMHQSQDINTAVLAVFAELEKLNLEILRCGIGIIDSENQIGDIWTTVKLDGKSSIQVSGKEPMNIHPLLQGTFDAWEKQTDFLYELKGEDLVAYYRAVAGTNFTLPESHSLIYENHSARQYYYTSTFKTGNLYAFRESPFPDDAKSIMRRFALVLNLTFSRFLDLQKAEAQAREAQIEAALEKVRSRSLAMHQSGELQQVINIVFEKFIELGIVFDGGALIIIFNEGSKDTTHWVASPGLSYSTCFRLPYIDHPIITNLLNARDNGVESLTLYYSFEEKNHFWKAAFEQSDYKYLPDEIKGAILESDSYGYSIALSKNSALLISSFSGRLFSESESSLLKRFARVFEQAYIRFLDLQRAELQAREAQIEASLERVRGKSMAMRNTGDLSAAASLVFSELQYLGINLIRSGVGLVTKGTRQVKIYSNTLAEKADGLSLVGELTLSGQPIFEQQYQSWLKLENYYTALCGKDLASYYQVLSAGLNADLNIDVKKNQEEYGHWFMFSEGFLYAWSDKRYSDAEIKILERFKNVIELTFRRYIELQKSEAQAREAIRQASLDRVRAEIASMRSIGDLDRITPLIWNELTILGVPFIRCGVFIVDDKLQQIHSYLSTPDGKAIAAFQIPFNTDGVGQAVLSNWRKNQAVTIHWTAEEFKSFSHMLVEQGEIESEENYLTARPPAGLHLHFFPFLQGMLYAGNTEPLNDIDKDLVQSIADAFSTAYARYEDFNRLELAKLEVERTLTDLKATQTRLIQSEKMASLGELTAGIAHEIQNPLNFVNNFSEVNQEMIDELEEELKAGNIEEALAIAAGIKQNEQKINHHGKRADGIVKGMLQHSRTSGGEKLPTNINSVAEEYMRLSYHGLRAKDKSFNAEMVMNLDPDLPRIQAVGQDIGRVMLNLFNNAFYAVNQKKKTAGGGYNPEVSVTTAAPPPEGGAKSVLIIVKDNGTGIPDHVKEKIMQPFFTTKPTGEGTGLGLSLTYDMVVKGHGGSIQVNSVEGEGSEFIIQLPMI